MKSSRKIILFFAVALATTTAHAQYGRTPIKHVVVIFRKTARPAICFKDYAPPTAAFPDAPRPARMGHITSHRPMSMQTARPDH